MSVSRATIARGATILGQTPDSQGYRCGLEPKDGILVLSGYGLRVAVERGQLAVSDGIGRERREGRLSRATCGLRRLVLLGHSGTISLEALRWLDDLGASITQIDADGNVVLASAPPRADDVRLRRAQALAPWTGAGVAIARELLRRKLEGQARVLAQVPGADGAIAAIGQAIADLEGAGDTERLRLVEARAAAAYWQAWATVPVRFARKDECAVPDHWRIVGSRTSPLTESPRRAANPANALLNYLYAILEAEARIALLAVGLDPGLGVLHADQRNRDSLACDLMEAIRPEVDAALLDLLRERTFAAKDFFETRQGDCRLLAPMTDRLAETAPRWAKAVAPVAEWMARAVLEGYAEPAVRVTGRTAGAGNGARAKAKRAATSSRPSATPLTQANRSAGRAGQRRRPAVEPQIPSAVLPATCLGCGGALKRATASYCATCLAGRRDAFMPDFTSSGPEALARLRAAGDDPAHGGAAGAKRSRRHVEQMRATAAWEEEHGSDAPSGVDFARDILPCLGDVSLVALMDATGLSRRYCWRIRRGEVVPHPRHWDVLRRL